LLCWGLSVFFWFFLSTSACLLKLGLETFGTHIFIIVFSSCWTDLSSTWCSSSDWFLFDMCFIRHEYSYSWLLLGSICLEIIFPHTFPLSLRLCIPISCRKQIISTFLQSPCQSVSFDWRIGIIYIQSYYWKVCNYSWNFIGFVVLDSSLSVIC
jgi:hypothetical protein